MKPVTALNIDFARIVPMETAEGQTAVKENATIGDVERVH